ncbi:type II toxin-antitoxin system VapC family toxin [Wenzhouxiangella marina]|uniref:Ribonuclease VapC n=1 Tax=Wenzhouxiangella marina TaxID=1579979 RepID=A0A0K0XUW0_9GAMM|nr:TA system VapC family ribonuclease toxin [Wenzhouxiangella marina]AKS41406.1 Ribonuclease VapC [Wenzhouxiangella marina]MBB6086840.1 hypothetical protein [Wenzhouxiangella marina]
MIAIDTNLLVYAHREDSPFHPQAYERIESLATSRAPWAIPWPCLHEFYSIATHPRIFDPPTPSSQALDQIDAWLECPGLNLISESVRHWSELRPMLDSARIVGPKVHDARIAAICLQHGVTELWTADRDFSVFPNLKARNPLVA